jgi:hypothetical protein
MQVTFFDRSGTERTSKVYAEFTGECGTLIQVVRYPAQSMGYVGNDTYQLINAKFTTLVA